MINWKNIFEEYMHNSIKNEFNTGRQYVENMVSTCNEIQGYCSKGFKSSNNLSSDRDSYYEQYVLTTLADFDSNYYLTNNSSGNLLPRRDRSTKSIDINTTESKLSTANKVIDKYINKHLSVNGEQFSNNTPYNVDYTNVPYSYGQSIEAVSSQANNIINSDSNVVSKFATHVQVLLDTKKTNDQRTDFHDDLLKVYTKDGYHKFSMDIYNKLSNIDIEADNALFMTHMEGYFDCINTSNIVDCLKEEYKDYYYTFSLIRMNYGLENTLALGLHDYYKKFEEEHSAAKEYMNAVENISTQIDLQIEAHSTEKSTLNSIISEISNISIDNEKSVVDIFDRLNEIYTLNDVSLNSNQIDVLDITDEEYYESNVGLDDELYEEIVNKYLDGDLTDVEILNLCVEYPSLNLFIEQYYIENIATMEDSNYWNNLTTLYSLNKNAQLLLEGGITEIENIEDVGHGKINFDAVTSGFSNIGGENEIKSCELFYVSYVTGAEGANDAYRSKLEEEKENLEIEINELVSKYEELDEYALGLLYDKLKAKGITTVKNISSALIEEIIGTIPGGDALMNLTIAEVKKYFQTEEDIKKLNNEIASYDFIIDCGDELSIIGTIPGHYSSLNIEGAKPQDNYIATPKTYQLFEIVEMLDKINDPNTSAEEKDALQLQIVEIANENGQIKYGHDLLDQIDYSFYGSDNIEDVYQTYLVANNDNSIDKFVGENYMNDEGVLDLNAITLDLYNNNYNSMFDVIDDDITNYAKKY